MKTGYDVIMAWELVFLWTPSFLIVWTRLISMMEKAGGKTKSPPAYNLNIND
jgi:hypothetical protein